MKKAIFILFFLSLHFLVFAQGVTTSSVSGVVDDVEGTLIGVNVEIIHEPSGTKYGAITNLDGQFVCTGLRVGGPYMLTFSYVGYRTQIIKDVYLNLGENASFHITLEADAQQLGEVVITGNKAANMKRTLNAGVGLIVNSTALSSMPTVSRSISDFTRLLPQAGANGILGHGGKSNNVTVDGATFNNNLSFG